MTIEEKRRELFEAHERGRDRTVSAKFCGQYVSENQQERWRDWNAALDAVTIELPPRWYWGGYDQECYMEAKDVEEAIESTGLGLKVMP